MAGVTPTEGLSFIGDQVYNNVDLIVGLFTNAALDASAVWADIIQPTGNGYAEITIPAGTWEVVNGNITLTAPIDFTANGGAFGPVYGAYIRSSGASPSLLHFEVNPSVDTPHTVNDTQVYRVDFSSVVS